MNKDLKQYYDTIRYLESITNLPQRDYLSSSKSRVFFIKRLKFFLNLLGNPQNDLKYIHIGGTSGKGSVANMVHSILTKTGYKVGLFTSPHPTVFTEKYKINNLLISPEDVTRIIGYLKPKIDEAYIKSPYGRPSYFEICTSLGFIYFKEQKCDYTILEVGLGGRYDTTNIIPPPIITIINLVDFDHTQLLGNTLEKITREKAAIIKPGTKFFTTSKNKRNVIKILKDTCRNQKAEFNLVKHHPETNYQLSLFGKHQQENAEIASAVCKKLGVSEDKIKKGLASLKISCRSEIIQKNPTVILDGAHNQSKMETVVKVINNLTYKKLYLIIGLSEERNPAKVFKNLIPLADSIAITRHQTIQKKSNSLNIINKVVKKIKPQVETKIYLDPFQALTKILNQAKKDDLIVITGSFYLAGELRKYWRPAEKILMERKS